MENSLIMTFLVRIFALLKEYYNHSYIKLIADKLLNSLTRMKEQSVIISAFNGESKLGRLWTESLFYRILMAPVMAIKKALSFIWKKTGKLVENSRILNGLDKVLSNLFHYSIRSYGAFLLGLFAVEAVLRVALQANDMKQLIIRAGLIGASLFMLLFDISVAALFKGSVLYRFVENGFVDSFTKYNLNKEIKSKHPILLLLAGAIFGVAAYFLPLKILLMAAAGCFMTVLILWRYETGVYLAAGFAALIPTTALYLIIGLTIVSFIFRWAVGRLPKYKATAVDALLVLFFAVLCYSTLTSYFIRDSIQVLAIHTLMLAFFFVVTRTINSKHKLYLLITLLIISASLTSLYGIYQYFGGSGTTDAWVDKTMFEDIQSRVGATFNNPNILGEYLILTIPLALSLLWYRKKLIYKGIFVGMLGVMAACMIFTFSRGAWLGLMLALVGFFVVRDKRLFALFLVALLIMPFALPTSVMNRFTSIGNMQDTSSSYRMSILLGSLRMAQDYWVSGIGLGSQAFKAIYPKYSLAAAYAHHSHNIYLQVILEMGVAGAVVFMLIILAFIRASLAHQGKTKDRFLSSVMIAACTGIAGYLVQGLVENVWYNYRVLESFWVVLAIGLCAINIAREKVPTDD